MTVDVECPEHGTIPVDPRVTLVGTDRAGLFATFVCPRCSIASGERTAMFWTIGPTTADVLIGAGARDLRHIGLASRVPLADRHPVPRRPTPPVVGRPLAAVAPVAPALPHQPSTGGRPVELDDVARSFANRITEDDVIEFGRLLEPLLHPAAFAHRQMQRHARRVQP